MQCDVGIVANALHLCRTRFGINIENSDGGRAVQYILSEPDGVRSPIPVLRKVSRFRYFAPAKCRTASSIVDPRCRTLTDCSFWPRYWCGSISFEGEWGHAMKAQGTKLQATENDRKRLMADVSRAMEKAQEAITRIASNPAVTATDTKRAHC